MHIQKKKETHTFTHTSLYRLGTFKPKNLKKQITGCKTIN